MQYKDPVSLMTAKTHLERAVAATSPGVVGRAAQLAQVDALVSIAESLAHLDQIGIQAVAE
ncbi:MAG: hypothetical protein ACRCYU_09130 [Nocardioides sp.]